MPRASLLRSWKRGSYLRRLFGLTLAPSTAALGAASWIASLQACRASPTALLENSKDLATAAALATVMAPSRTPCASSPSLDPPWSGLKTCLPGLEGDSSDQSERSYAEWVTRSQNRSSSLRRMLVHRIGVNGSLCWPTARTEDGESCGNHPGATDSLTGATRTWMTPAANEGQGKDYTLDRGNPDSPHWQNKVARGAVNAAGMLSDDLSSSATNWPTPAARDHKGTNSQQHMNRTDGRTDGRSRNHANQLPNFVMMNFSHPDPQTQDGPTSSPESHGSPRRLNPAFGCWLMGLPSWWTNSAVTSCAQSEMARYRQSLRQRLSCLLED